MMNDNRPSPELLIGLYAASASTIAIAALARVGGVKGKQIGELAASLEMCTAQSTGFAAIDQHLAQMLDLLNLAKN